MNGRSASRATQSSCGRGDGGEDSGRVFLDDDEVAQLVNDLITPMTLVASAGAARPARRPRQLPRLVGRAPVAHRRAARAHRGSVAVPRRRRMLRSTSSAPSRSTTPTTRSRTTSRRQGCLHLSGWFDPGRWSRSAGRWTTRSPEHYTPDDGRSWWAETADGTARGAYAPTLRGAQPDVHRPAARRALPAHRSADR